AGLREQPPRADEVAHPLDLRAERPVLQERRDELGELVAGAFERGRERRISEVTRLPEGEELVGKHELDVVEESTQLLGAKERERLEVLLARRGVGHVDGSGQCQHAVLDAESDDSLVQDGRARVPPRLGGQLLRKAREARIEQAMEPLLGEVRELREGNGERVETERERLGVKVPRRIETLRLAVGREKVERAVSDRTHFLLESPLDSVENLEHGTVPLRHDAEGN